MENLSSKVQNALDEARILVLGIQVLVGFGFRSFFEQGFERVPASGQAVKLGALCLELVALALVVLPGPYHRIVEGGEDTGGIVRVSARCIALALLPFALGMGGDAGFALAALAGPRGALVLGAAVALAAAAAWYAVPLVARRRRGRPREERPEMAESSVDKKIRHVLTEARMVLPGAQALVGFQLAATSSEAFRELPRTVQWIHVGAVLLTAATIVLLIAPAAYHRIVEAGEATEGFHRVASALVLAAIAPLSFSLSADLGVVAYRLFRSAAIATALGAAALGTLLTAWYALPLVARAARRGGARAPAHA